MVMELGWLMGHLVYVRGLLPELFGALAEVQPAAPVPERAGASAGAAAGDGEAAAKARLDPLQCVLLELLSEEMEHGSTGQQLKCARGLPCQPAYKHDANRHVQLSAWDASLTSYLEGVARHVRSCQAEYTPS